MDVGYEVFLGPESFFSPEIIDKNWRTPIDELIELTVHQSPIDYRRKLYSVSYIDYLRILYYLEVQLYLSTSIRELRSNYNRELMLDLKDMLLLHIK